MTADETNKDDAETDTKAEHKAKEIKKPRRRHTMLDVLIYCCAALVIIGGLCLSYLGVAGGFQNQRVLALTILYGTMLFVLTGAYLYFLQNLRFDKVANAAPTKTNDPNRPWVNAESVTLVKPLLSPPEGRFYLLVDVALKNTGQSAAVDGLIMAVVEADYTPTLSKNVRRACDSAREMQEVKEKNTPWETGFVLAPGNTLTLPIGMGSDSISPEQIRAGQFYVLGCVVYRDEAKASHHTQFCFAPIGPITDQAKIGFRRSPWYHEAD
jgi:hypothetical protein